MTLSELSPLYAESARLLRQRLKELRSQLPAAKTSEEYWQLKRRITELSPMLTQMNDLAELTARYYDKGYWKNEKYTL